MKTWNVFCAAAWLAATTSSARPLPAGNQLLSKVANLPISFEANLGQANPAARFLAHGQGGDLLLTRNEAWLTLQRNRAESGPGILRLKLAGANPDPKLEGLSPLPGRANYLFGQDSSQWRTNIPTFSRVKYHDVYPGIDLVFYGSGQKIEYDFIVLPGADPGTILLGFGGAEKISLDANGDLLLGTGDGSVHQHQPVVYQEVDGRRKMLAGNYVLHSAMQVGFQVADYDRSKPLIIDPVLAYSATFGGSGLNQALGVATDFQGNVYVTGVTGSRDFPTANPFQANMLGSRSAFVVKFDTNNAVVYATYLGGGALNDVTTTFTAGHGIAVDGNGNAFVTGYTTATNFPVLNAFQSVKGSSSFSARNAFVTKLNPAGNGLVYSTYLGGAGSDTATGIALNTNAEAIVTGFTSSTNFPTVNAAQPIYGGNGDAFVARLNTNGSALLYSTYLGGASYENEDLSNSGNAAPVGAVAADLDGNAYVTGLTYSTNFPVLNAFQPTNATSFYPNYSAAFVTKLAPSGSLVYSTYFGGRFGDLGRAIGVDFQGNVYFAGNSVSGHLPTTHAYQSAFGGNESFQTGDGFVAALDTTGTNLIYCTYLGGSGDDQINGIAVRPEDGAVAVTGFTDSPNFPLRAAVQPTGYQGFFKSANGAAGWSLSNAGLASGVIYSIQIDPSNPEMIYALTKNGCFKSTDGGVTWAEASRGLGSISPSVSGSPASLLAIDPQRPGTLYVGAYSGVYKTTNGAVNWTLANTGIPSFPDILSLAIDPSTPATLYAGTYFNGIYKTTNGGARWNVVTNGLNVQNIQALVVDPNNSSNVYAGAGGFTFNVSVFKSTNSGANWNLLGGGLPGGAVNLLAASSSQLYAVIGNSQENPPGSAPALKFSTNGGLNWTTLLKAAGLSFTALAVAPASSAVLTVADNGGADSLSWPDSFNAYILQFSPSLNPPNWTDVLQSRATNNGSYFIAYPMSGPQGFYRLLRTGSAPETPTLYLGTDQASGQGVLKSTDGGRNWSITGLAGDTVNALAVNPADPRQVYAGMNGGRDGFVAALSPAGQLYSCTYSGGSGLDQGNAVALVDSTSLVSVGSTASRDFPRAGATVAHAQKLARGPIDWNTAPRDPMVTESTGANDSGQATVDRHSDSPPCPQDKSVTLEVTQRSRNVLHLLHWIESSDYSAAEHAAHAFGVLPQGFTLSHVLFGGVGSSHYIDLEGVVTANVGTYSVSIIITQPKCPPWTIFLTIIVK